MRFFCSLAVALGLVTAAGQTQSMQPDINAVLAAHDKQLLAIPGVVGVYVGVLEDGKSPCLKVMLSRPTPEAEREIPREIDGYTVVIAVTGEVRPLKE